MKQVERNNFGGYYKIPIADNHIIFGVRPLHCFSCGYIDDTYELLCIFWDIDSIGDTQGERQESFDFAPTDGDAIVATPLVQAALSGVDIEPSEEMLSGFCGSSALAVWSDLQAELSPYAIMEKRLGILVDQYVGESFEEVMYENPTWLVETVSEDEEGNASISYNITKPVFRGGI